MPPKPPSPLPLDLSGKWIVASLPSMDDDYLELTDDPHVQIKQTASGRFRGSYHFAAQDGEVDGRIDEAQPNVALLSFTFEGTDEGDEFHGAGVDVVWKAKGDQIVGVMRYHNGDDLPFVWKRAKAPPPPKPAVPPSKPRPRKKGT